MTAFGRFEAGLTGYSTWSEIESVSRFVRVSLRVGCE